MSAKIDLNFLCQEAEGCFASVKYLDVSKEIGEHAQVKNNNVIQISLTEFNRENVIWLDISTAIKFAKTLRTEINKAKEGGQNG